MIDTIDKSQVIGELDSDMIRAIQVALSELGYYPPDKVDGISGPITEAALKEFKNDYWLAYPTVVGNSTINKLNELTNKDNLPPTFNVENKEETIYAIIKEGYRQGMSRYQTAYALATTDHETNHTFKPVTEAYWLSERWRRNNLRYYPFYG